MNKQILSNPLNYSSNSKLLNFTNTGNSICSFDRFKNIAIEIIKL